MWTVANCSKAAAQSVFQREQNIYVLLSYKMHIITLLKKEVIL